MGTAADFKKKYITGRPTKMTDEILSKLRDAYLIGANDEQAAYYANIGTRTLYRFMEKNEWFRQEKKIWQENPKLKAKQTLFSGLNEPDRALKYLELRQTDEFSKLNKVSDADGKPLVVGFNYIVPPAPNEPDSDSSA